MKTSALVKPWVFALGTSAVLGSTALAAPLLPADLAKDLARDRGQSTFANPAPRVFMAARMAAMKSNQGTESASTGERREQQESDIFKVGAPGSQLLYLLNNYRGLQVVSFARGATQPKLVGRVKATGNYPENMYLDVKHSRILVLETLYDGESSRILSYDVTAAERPKLQSIIPVEGEMADSRIVGDVLYVATSARPDPLTAQAGRRQLRKGKVFSYSLKDPEVRQVDSTELSLATSRRENMGIVEILEGGRYKYYLTAVLSENGWGWWDRQSWVEVIDISDPAGHIRPVMSVAAKGFVDRRQQVTVKDGTLIVTSNYSLDSEGNPARWGGKARIAVEAFKLPEARDETLSEEEAQYRRLHIERALNTSRGKTADELDELRAQLVANADLGLKGRFVRQKKGAPRKLVPDAAVTVGDSTGQSASLRDVRYVDDKLYVFWVPANNIDPFDLFDIRDPATSIRHLKRLQFDGWIEKAIPISHKGHDYVIGLGWVVQNVNNELGRRFPQAMLFEIVNRGGQLRPVDTAQLTLLHTNVWANLNDQDKLIDVRMNEQGKGTILFQISSYENGDYVQGGKLIGFDLNQATVAAEKVFTEGGLLVADSAWLRRVFNNPEIGKVNAFSDKTLGTFSVDARTLGNSRKMHRALSTLELARDIRSYSLLSDGTSRHGVQIISDGDYWSWREASTTLRLVSPTAADSEKDTALSELSLKGTYMAHCLVADGRILLVSTLVNTPIDPHQSWRIKRTEFLHAIRLAASGLQISASKSWDVPEQPLAQPEETTIVPLSSTQAVLLSRTTGTLKRITLAAHNAGLGVSDTMFASREIQSGDGARIVVLGGRLFVTYKKLAATIAGASRYDELQFHRHYLAPLVVQADDSWSHGIPINIPGRPLALFKDQHLVTEDERLMDIEEKAENHDRTTSPQRSMLTEKALTSLRLERDKAVLVDSLDSQHIDASGLKVSSQGFVYLAHAAHMTWRPHWPQPRAMETRFAGLSFDADLFFKRHLKAIRGLELKGDLHLVQVAENPSQPGTHLGVLTNGSKAQLIAWASEDLTPVVVPIQFSDESGQKMAAVTMFDLPTGMGYWTFRGESGRIHFSHSQKTIEIAGGLSGVLQLQRVQ